MDKEHTDVPQPDAGGESRDCGGSDIGSRKYCLKRDLYSGFHSLQQEPSVRMLFPSFWITGSANSKPAKNVTGEGGLIGLFAPSLF